MEKRTLQKVGLLCASVVLCSAASWWSGSRAPEPPVQKMVSDTAVEDVQPVQVTVCISGAVAKPGLYQVPRGSRAQQVIELAGGVTEEADMDRVNLAQLCKDGGHIKVPRLSQARLKKKLREKAAFGGMQAAGRTEGPAYSGTAANQYNERNTAAGQYAGEKGVRGQETRTERFLVHLNSASEAELEHLPGVGRSTARQIVLFRAKHGFQHVEDIMQVPGIGPAKFEKMRGCLAL